VTVADVLLLALGAIAVGGGAFVVTSAHLVRAGLHLVISLGAIAGLYLVLGAELVAWVQILVYVGAVVVLLLFAVMLTRAPIGPSADLDRPAGPAALIGAGVGLGLTALLADAFRWTRYELPPAGTAERVGGQVFGDWVLPFEVLSLLLLAALVGAIVLSRPDLGARPDPEAVAGPAPAPGPDVDESAEVVARLERIAARQAAAQARVRAAAAAAGEPDEIADEAEPADPLKARAAEVVFGAHERVRAAVREGQSLPDEPPRRVASTVGIPEPGSRDGRPPVGRPTARPALPSAEQEPGTAQKAGAAQEPGAAQKAAAAPEPGTAQQPGAAQEPGAAPTDGGDA
jgi:NADH:ubiquinone oxidoreductase subunit 6 (subunit J)